MGIMLQSCHDSCRSRRASLAAGMALALAGRAVGFVPSGTRAAYVRPRALPKEAARTSSVYYGNSFPRSIDSYRRFCGATSIWMTHVTFASRRGREGCRRVHGAPLMCSAQASTAGSGAIEVSAEAAALEAQIKEKGDAIRELKAAGTAKDSLKPYIEVSRPLHGSMRNHVPLSKVQVQY